MKYIKQLDSIRAIAVILVIISHWLPGNFITNSIPLGEVGVDVFFVLSGFLITTILFNNRNQVEEKVYSKKKVLINFYVRRTLRIFPIYYLVIFILYCFRKYVEADISSAWGYLVTYTSNFYFFSIQSWDGLISHLWSLAVEEQFYLIWPWLVLFVPRKNFRFLILSFIIIGIGSQYLVSGIHLGYILTFTCFDAFGFGALLAWYYIYSPASLKSIYKWVKAGALASVLIIAIQVKIDFWYIIPLRTLIAIIATWIIAFILLHREKQPSLGWSLVLDNRVLIFLGKISYGIYLYHNLIPTFNRLVISPYMNSLIPAEFFTYQRLLFISENILILVLMSWLSFLLIEKRFLALKKYFEY